MSRARIVDFIIGVPLVFFLSFFNKKAPMDPKKIKKVLIIKLAAVGDTILLEPVVSSLRISQPALGIHLLVSDINYSVASAVLPIDNLINLHKKSISNFLRVLFKMRKEKYDLIIDLEQWARGTALLSFLSGAPQRIGFDTPGQYRQGLYTESTRKSSDNHEIFEFYNVLSLVFDIARKTEFHINVSSVGEMELNERLPAKYFDNQKLKILIHPGCGSDGRPREWPLLNYGVLINWIKNKWDAMIFISGGPDETKLTEGLLKMISQKGTDCGGKLSWMGTFSLVSRMDLVISGNTGIMHVAAAFRKKQVALHGPTNPHMWGPLNPQSVVIQSTCDLCPCLSLGFEYHAKDQACMEKISIDEVKNAVESLIDRKPVIL